MFWEAHPVERGWKKGPRVFIVNEHNYQCSRTTASGGRRTRVLARKRNANRRHFPRTRTRERDISRSHDYSIYENDYWERRARVTFSINRVSPILASRRNIGRDLLAVQLKATSIYLYRC